MSDTSKMSEVCGSVTKGFIFKKIEEITGSEMKSNVHGLTIMFILTGDFKTLFKLFG